MSAHTKVHPTNHIDVKVQMPGGKAFSYHIPSSKGKKLNSFLKGLLENEIEAWENATPWEVLAKDRIERYKKAGIVLRGARYKNNLSQIKLAELSGVHQNEISKIENGKRSVGLKVAKKLAKSLKIDYQLLIEK